MSESLSRMVETLTGVYQSQDNDTRRRFTLELERLEAGLRGEDLVAVGLSLLSGAADLAVVQAYGAVLLTKALRTHGVPVAKLPFWDLLRWYATDASLNRLLCADLEALLLAAALRLPDEDFSRFLDRLLAGGDLAGEGRRVGLLAGVVVKCAEPDLGWVPRGRVGPLRRVLRARAPAVLGVVNQTLFSVYAGAGGADLAGPLPPPADAVVEGCLGVLGALAPAPAADPARAPTFHALAPRDLADEVCPRWTGAFVHALVNGATDLLTLALAMQLTQAALRRARAVLACVRALPARHPAPAAHAPPFEPAALAALQASLPRREEFWHRATQQLHGLVLARYHAGPAADDAKLAFVLPRIFLLMRLYTEVFDLREPWTSALPGSFLPAFRGAPGADPAGIIAAALRENNDLLAGWAAEAVGALCGLLVAGLARGVAMPRLHHITMRSPRGGIAEWPPLLSLLLWAVKRRGGGPSSPDKNDDDGARAIAWVARLLQWVVHGATVRFGCDYAESLLWVQNLTEESLPSFLHGINNLLQRSLSKAADRLAEELDSGNPGYMGALLPTCKTFIAKYEEKQRQEKAARPGDAEVSNRTSSTKKTAASPATIDLWIEDLKISVPALKAVVASVEAQWASRHQLTADRIALIQTLHENNAENGQKKLVFAVKDVVSAQDRLMTPLHTQLKDFCQTLRPPTAPVYPGNEEGARSEEELALQVAIASANLPLVKKDENACEENHRNHPESCVFNTLKNTGVQQWSAMTDVCWSLAGRLLKELSEACTACETRHIVELRTFACEALREIAAQSKETSFLSLLRERPDSQVIAFFTLVLTFLRILLASSVFGMRTSQDGPRPLSNSEFSSSPLDLFKLREDDTFEAIARMLLSTYSGTLSTVDRIRYAALLSLHYCAEGKRNEWNGKAAAQDAITDTAQDDAEALAQKESDDESISEEVKAESNLMMEVERGEAREKRPHTSRRGVFSGALVPSEFVRNRYLISQHTPAAFQTPEPDMLSLLLESLTDEDIVSLSLNCPARLHNTLLCGTTNPAWDLLRSIFPELAVEGDLVVGDLGEVSSPSLLDPRYLLPLIQTVTSLPECGRQYDSSKKISEYTPYRFLGTRCVPFLIRALSFTDDGLRRMSVAALYHAYIPGGPHLIISTFARLKMIHLAEKQSRQRRQPHRRMAGGEKQTSSSLSSGLPGNTSPPPARSVAVEEAASPPLSLPRLPAPISSFLILSLPALARYEDPLHNHLIRFLVDPRRAFSTAVPFADWSAAFPLAAISFPLMIQQQQRQQFRQGNEKRGESGKDKGGGRPLAATSAEDAMAELEKDTPPQLDFVLRVIRHGCDTHGDVLALAKSEALQRVLLLAIAAAASTPLRLSIVESFAGMLARASSQAVTRQLAMEGGLLRGFLAFTLALARENGEHNSHSTTCAVESPLFFDVLRLLRQLSEACLFGHPKGFFSPIILWQTSEEVKQLRGLASAAGVSARQTLEELEELHQLWDRAVVEQQQPHQLAGTPSAHPQKYSNPPQRSHQARSTAPTQENRAGKRFSKPPLPPAKVKRARSGGALKNAGEERSSAKIRRHPPANAKK